MVVSCVPMAMRMVSAARAGDVAVGDDRRRSRSRWRRTNGARSMSRLLVSASAERWIERARGGLADLGVAIGRAARAAGRPPRAGRSSPSAPAAPRRTSATGSPSRSIRVVPAAAARARPSETTTSLRTCQCGSAAAATSAATAGAARERPSTIAASTRTCQSSSASAAIDGGSSASSWSVANRSSAPTASRRTDASGSREPRAQRLQRLGPPQIGERDHRFAADVGVGVVERGDQRHGRARIAPSRSATITADADLRARVGHGIEQRAGRVLVAQLAQRGRGGVAHRRVGIVERGDQARRGSPVAELLEQPDGQPAHRRHPRRPRPRAAARA